MLTVLLIAPITAGLLLLSFGGPLGRRSFLVAAALPLLVFGWAAAQISGVLDGAVPAAGVAWVPELGLSLDLRLDGFSLLFVLLVAGIGTLVQLYASQYFPADRAGLHRLAGLLLIFTAAMLGLVTAANLLVLFVAWELTSVTSYLLIGWTDTDPKARASALQALLTTGLGGIAMLGGFVLIGEAAGTYDLAALAAHPPTGTTVEVGLLLVLLGAFTKSAQFPFSAWLPGAMVAPTPVSAFLHSATMVKAGVYLIARLAPIFATQGLWRPVVLVVGLATMLTGGWHALHQYDLKRILAYGTVSQLGFMVVLFGVGTPEATTAGVIVLFAHALFKAGLFLVVGVIDHQAHTRDIRRLGRYGPGWAGPMVIATICGASMAGIPPLLGFIGKEAAYDSFVDIGIVGGPIVLAGLVAGSVLTFAYTARLLLGAFRPGVVTEGLAEDPDLAIDPPPAPKVAFWLPAALLGLLTVLFGLVPRLISHLVEVAAHSLDPLAESEHLALWHGVGPALVLSGLTVLLGAALTVAGPAFARLQHRLPSSMAGERGYLGAIRGLNVVANRTTGFVQPGSLPIYIGVILLTAVLVPGFALLRAPRPPMPPLVSSPGDWAAAALMISGGIAAVVVRHRMAAVLCAGAVGYGMALVFALQGAPDLALTQVCVDTIGAVIFVLVLRHLPAWFSDRPTSVGRISRIIVSAAVGIFVFSFLLVAGDSRVDPTISTEFIDQAFAEGGGRNVVNVVLVDIRGFDTMGEITVLSVAAMGVYALARLSRRERGVDRSFSPSRRIGERRPRS
ncbi:hydrogen gas-evolving membrane-bound hydrogenase subunit E [Aquihabitans sp. McL0605]|uniref:hydrogen gas-evolving membrane-bound hydrogenase subunit E n=1 Tax=Aquihabitans sp. McL0605 TaxID=3415671 RepID=UPI003CF5EF64